MSGKSRFQISRSLDERIKRIISGSSEHDLDYAEVSSAYILGFNYGNVTSYVGLTTNYQLHHSGFPVVGLAFFRASPSDEEIKSKLKAIKEYSSSPNGLGSFESDKNEHLFLIYSINNDTNEVDKRIFNFDNESTSLQEQPKLSILDDSKIYKHSAMVRLVLTIKLELCESEHKLLDKDKIEAEINNAKRLLANETKSLSIHLKNSNFSTKTPLDNNNSIESLYSHLDTPREIEQVGDYLPQMTKEDKAKMLDKWRNKVRDQRAALEIELEQDDLSVGSDNLDPKFYRLHLEEFFYLHVNDSISKGTKMILFLFRQQLELLKLALIERAGTSIETDEFKFCTFKPAQLNHFVTAVYPIPSMPSYEHLANLRKEIHQAYLLLTSQPAVRYSQRITNINLSNDDEKKGYLCNVHSDILEKSGIKGGSRNVIKGTYTYHHYLQDRAQDNGWGCAYRSLQTIISWFKHQAYIYSPDVPLRAPKSDENDKTSSLREKLTKESRVPTHEEIQMVLVDVGDKEPSFIGSQKWIGSQEVCYVLNHLYNLESKFISVSSGNELVYKARDLGQHFATQSTPVMIGGGVLAHTIIGVDFNEKNGDVSYLILDPHYTGSEDLATVTKKGWCGWKKNAFWDKSAFYNLCLPQRPIEF